MTDEEITTCDLQEWADYLVNKYIIEPIILFENDIERSIQEEKVKQRNPFYGYAREPAYYEVDGVSIKYSIPFDGDAYLFEICPGTRILDSFSTDQFVRPKGDKCGYFSLSLKYAKSTLQNFGEEMAVQVQRDFDNKFRDYRKMINNVNAEVDSYNRQLSSVIIQYLEKRKEKAASFVLISNMLQIPLVKNSNAPNVTPIPLKRVTRTPASKPLRKQAVPESCISDGDYKNINNIIVMCGTTMEKTARSYYLNNEEELRDHLLAALNTHYNAATGETFRKIGKTDILIEFENKAAYIGECKIWHGEKLFQDAITQVLNYSTWRDIKVTVIIFNKENQNFKLILEKISSWVKTEVVSFNQPQENVWNCRYHRPDMNIDIDLAVVAFDLYVNKKQFKDSRIK